MYSEQAYETLLALMVEQEYNFKLFTEQAANDQKVIYLRHDIDYSPDIALRFAEINRRAGVQATFFFQLRSKIYNLLAAPTLEIIDEIQALGQKIAMHFVLPKDFDRREDVLRQKILADYEIMKACIRRLQPIFSWHNPSSHPGLIEGHLNFTVPWLVNTYDAYFFNEVAYFSDSDLRYSVEEFRQLITAGHTKMQLLFHPFQWVCGAPDMVKVISSTWPQIIREREQGVLENKIYRKHYPQGMPMTIIDSFANAVAGQ